MRQRRSHRTHAAAAAKSRRIAWLAHGTVVISRDAQISGAIIGYPFECQLEGCSGVRVPVRWDDGTRTYPCSKGLMPTADGSLRIGGLAA